jgi:hypothetical protein
MKNIVYTVMEFKAGQVKNELHAKVCAKVFQNKAAKLVQIDFIGMEFAYVKARVGDCWLNVRVPLESENA